MRCTRVVIWTVVWSVSCGPPHPDTVYTVDGVVELPTLGGNGSARAVNSRGRIVGWSFHPGSSDANAVLWDNQTITDLSQSGWVESFAWDVNEAGHVTGWFQNAETRWAWLLHDGVFVGIGEQLERGQGRSSSSAAYAINEHGEVVGQAREEVDGEYRGSQAVRWQTQSAINWEFMGTQDRNVFTSATDVNEQSMATGWRTVSSYIDENGQRIQLDDFAVFFNSGGTTSDWTLGDGNCGVLRQASVGVALNNNGWMVGAHDFGPGPCRAVRFQSSEPPILLSGTSDTTESEALDVNDGNIIVGQNDGQPVYWPPGEGAVTLPMGTWDRGAALGISNANVIVGWLGSGATRVPVMWQLETRILAKDDGPP